MIQIKQYDIDSIEALAYYKWITELWDKVNPYLDSKNNVKIPKPLLATIEGQLVGGLSFTIHKEPDLESNVVWVNTIYILENHRRQGLASLLLQEAVKVIDTNLQSQLYAYTYYPDLYTKHGWHKLEKHKDVVGISLIGEVV